MLRQLCHDFSAGLATAVFAFLVHDSDVLLYLLYESGRLVAEFDSWPDYHRSGGPPDEGDTPGTGPQSHPDQLLLFDVGEGREAPTPGNPEAILRHCVRGTTLRQVVDLLGPDSWAAREAAWNEGREEWLDAFSRHARLARLLGIDEELACLGFRHIEERLDEEGRDALPGVRKVRGKGTRRLLEGVATPRTLAQAVSAGDTDSVRRFLAEGSDPNGPGRDTRSVLDIAIGDGHFEIALALLASGAQPSSASVLLMRAVSLGRSDILPALIASSAADAAAVSDVALDGRARLLVGPPHCCADRGSGDVDPGWCGYQCAGLAREDSLDAGGPVGTSAVRRGVTPGRRGP